MIQFEASKYECKLNTILELELAILDYKKQHRNFFVPYLNLPNDCEIMFTPTYLAQARFIIRRKSNPSVQVSVYLDLFCLLGGSENNPYWEVYDIQKSECHRYLMNNVKGVELEVLRILDEAL